MLIEATSLAILSWLRGGADRYGTALEIGMKWLATRCKDGAFGSTQSVRILFLPSISSFLFVLLLLPSDLPACHL